MAGGVNIWIHLRDHPFWIDQIGDTLGEKQAVRSVGFDSVLVCVREQEKWKMVFIGKFLVTFGRVCTHAQDHDPEFLKVSELIADGAGFFGTTWGIILWIKIEENPLALELVEDVGLIVLREQGKSGRWGVWLQHIY